ncbi:hypothetical protein EHS39_35980 [Ensifer sp. MPMI2T]|nr:hypothetical protein EHS39_35980 [Ensifer sp. MPMI2T]
MASLHPPLPCRASPSQGGDWPGERALPNELAKAEAADFQVQRAVLIGRAENRHLPISALVGEMPGRAEGAF